MKRLLFSALTLIVTNVYSQVPNYVSKTGILGWYSFTGNSVDSSGAGGDCIVTGATLVTDRFNNANSSYVYNGNSDYMVSPAGFPYSSNDKSFSIWFKIDTLKRGWVIAGGTDKYDGSAFGLYFQDNTSRLAFHGNGSYDCVLDTISDTSKWHHAVISYSKDTLRYYKDGVLKVTSVTTLKTGSSDIVIGRRKDASLESGTDAYFSGRIDDIGMWDRGLTECEVTRLYTADTTCTKTSTLEAVDVVQSVISVSPNPADNIVNIDGVKVEKVEVINLMGQIVLRDMNKRVDLSELRKDVYILRINNTFTTKIIKN